MLIDSTTTTADEVATNEVDWLVLTVSTEVTLVFRETTFEEAVVATISVAETLEVNEESAVDLVTSSVETLVVNEVVATVNEESAVDLAVSSEETLVVKETTLEDAVVATVATEASFDPAGFELQGKRLFDEFR